MRQAIKSDGSDGTAALKAWLLAHGDQVLKQELYEFTKPGIGAGLGRSPSRSSNFVVQSANLGNIGGTSLFPGTVTLANPSPVGNILFAIICAGDGGPTAAVSDTGFNTWVPLFTRVPTAFGFVSICRAVSNGSTVSATFTTGGSRSSSAMYVVEVPAAYSGTLIAHASGVGSGFGSASTSDGNVLNMPFSPSGMSWDLFMISLIPPAGAIPGVSLGYVVFNTNGTPANPIISHTFLAQEVIGPFDSGELAAAGAISPVTLGRFTDASSPLTYGGQVYSPANIKNDGFKSKIGLDVDSLQLTWTFRGDEPMVIDPDTSATILTLLQGFKYGLWAGVWVKWRRIYMPVFGDCETLAAVSEFRGRIGPVEVDRLKAKITVNSVTEMFNRQVPQQLIEANNRSGQIGPGLPPDLNADPSHWTIFECVAGAGGTVQKIVAQQTDPTAGDVYAPGTFDLGYLLFQASPLQFFVAQVQHYDVEAGYNVFYLFKPLYVDPHTYPLSFIGFVPIPKDQTVSGAGGVELPPFPRVPLPEQAV